MAVDVQSAFNLSATERSGGDYERHRWFATPRLRLQYRMTRLAIERHLLGADAPASCADCLELGPGPGTWTKLLLERYPSARFDLVDISEEMLRLAERSLSHYRSEIRYHRADFLSYAADRQYDLFFSSRAIEYIPSKAALVTKVVELLKPGGRGFIVTKVPHYTRQRLLGRAAAPLHRHQVSAAELAELLQRQGCRDVAAYPATTNVPLISSLSLNRWVHERLYVRPLSRLSQTLTESYCLTFTKHGG